MARYPGLGQNPNTQQIAEALGIIVGERGDKLDRAVTFRDLLDKDVLKWKDLRRSNLDPDRDTEPTNPPEPSITPPAPTGISVTPAIQSILLEFDDPYAKYAHHSLAEIWRHTSDNLANATLVGTTDGLLYADNVGLSASTRYYWVRFVSTAGIEGPFNSANGTSGTTGRVGNSDLQDDLITANKIAQDAVTESKVAKWFAGTKGSSFPSSPDDGQFFYRTDQDKAYRYRSSTDTWRSIDFLDDPNRVASAVIGSAAIIDAAITNAKIDNAAVGSAAIADLAVTNAAIDDLAVTDAKINDVDANKITANKLSAISADLGSITGGSLDINGRFKVDSNGNVDIISSASGQRMEIENNVIKVFDSNGTLRVQMGDLTA